MKIFLTNSLILLVSICISQTTVYARGGQPSSNLAAYHNKIVDMYDIDEQHDQRAMILTFQHHPVCIYTPLSYQDSLATSVQKTYFLPRTRLSDFQKHRSYNNLRESLQKFGIVVQIDEIVGAHYGLQINFVMPSCDQYDIASTIDRDHNIVRFDIAKKI